MTVSWKIPDHKVITEADLTPQFLFAGAKKFVEGRSRPVVPTVMICGEGRVHVASCPGDDVKNEFAVLVRGLVKQLKSPMVLFVSEAWAAQISADPNDPLLKTVMANGGRIPPSKRQREIIYMAIETQDSDEILTRIVPIEEGVIMWDKAEEQRAHLPTQSGRFVNFYSKKVTLQ